MRALLPALLLAITAVASVPSADAAACTTDLNPTDDNGVSATCPVYNTGYSCTASAGAYGDPRPRATCGPPIIICVREPCP